MMCFKWISVLANTVTSLSFIFGICQFYSYKQDLKTERSFSFSNKFFEQHIIDKTSKFLIGEKRKSAITFLRNNAKNDLIADKLIKNYLFSIVKNHEFEWFMLLDFYSSVFQCVYNNLCDKKNISYTVLHNGRDFFINTYNYYCYYLNNKKNPKDIDLFKKVALFYRETEFNCD